jgi:hypothetical protein
MTTPTAAPLRAGTWDSPIGVIVADRGRGLDRRYAVGPASQMRVTDRAGLVSAVRDEEAKAPLRWVLWAAGDVAPDLVAEGLRLARAWDVSEAHRLLHGGWEAHPGMSWAAAHGIPLDEVPTPPTGDLFEFATTPTDDGGLIRSDGHLRPDAVHGDWVDAPDRLLAWAQAALDTAAAQRDRAASLGPRVVSTIHSESAAALLCVDLAHDGLPLDRGAVEGLIAEATLADDLYAPVAQRLGAERAVAKIAVLAAMYGQRSGAAGEALKGLERAYPVAMAHLDRAYAVGVRGGDLRTFGGRLLPTGRFLTGAPIGTNPPLDSARGRFARNAVIQGAAAELFKAWAVTVRALGRPLGAEIVLCLHDELLVHVPEDSADDAAALVDQSLVDAARRWSGGAPVRFVADTSVIRRWSEAK